MTHYSIEAKTRKYVKGYRFCHLQETIGKIWEKYRKKFLNATTKTRCCKSYFQKSSP